MIEHGNRYANLLPLANDGDAWIDKQYSAKVRIFPGGAVEVCTSIVNGIQRKKHAESAWYGGLLRMSSPESEEEQTPEQIEEAAKRKAEDNKARAVRRAKQHVRFAVKAIQADHLLTLTYRTVNDVPMDDLDRLKADWKRFCRLVKQGLPASERFKAHAGLDTWKFVAIREKQDNGAYHLHCAVVGRQDITFIRRCWFVAIGGHQDDQGADTLGNIDVRGPSKRWGAKTLEWKQDKLAGYMTKYLHKTFDDLEEKGSKRYWAGRTNDKPQMLSFWLGAQCFEDAIKESHSIFRFYNDAPGIAIWASQGYDSIWLSG
jgi:hypothetical protein